MFADIFIANIRTVQNVIYLNYENSLRSQTLACNTIYKIKLLDAYQIVKQGIYDHNVQLARSRVL